MSNQIVISSGAKVRSLEGVLTGTSGIVNSVPLGGANGVATLDSNGKVPLSQLPASVVTYLGTWNAATNTPTLANGTGDIGDLYICNVAGTVNFGAGPITFAVSDWVIYNGSEWQKSSGASGTVTSVAVTSTGNDAISITGSPITTAGTINIGFTGTSAQYVNGAGDLTTFPSLTGYVPYTGATTDVDLGVHVLNAQALHVKGTAGAGHLGLKHQSAAATGSANESLIYANVDGDLAWQNDNLYLTTLSTHANTANRVYTFPDASGTIALTSNLSSYVPYTGATTNVNLGSYGLSGNGDFVMGSVKSAGIFAESGAGAAGYLYLKGDSSFGLLSGYNSIFANGFKYGFEAYGGSSLNSKRAYLDFGSLTNNTTRTYTFPNASGTIALTSDISYPVTSVFGRTGAVTAQSGDYTTTQVTEGTNLYYTDARARGAISLTTTGTSGAATYNSTTGVLNVPNYGSALSGYVPYTGATSDVNLGYRSISASNINIDGYSFGDGGAINFKQFTSLSLAGTGYTSIGANSTNILTFGFNQGSLNLKGFKLDVAGLTTNVWRTYTMPNADGTIALTSDIPSLANYVSLTGTQTITGVKTFSNEQLFSNGLTINGGYLTFADSGFSSTLDTTTLTASRAILLPNASGTLALTSQLTNGTVTSVGLSSATSGVTIGSSPITTSGTITLAIATASGSQQGLLSSTDWTTFNNKQNALTNPVTGTGTSSYHAKFTGTSTIGNSMLTDDGTTLQSIGATRSNLYLKAASSSYYSQLAFTNGTNGSFGGISYNNSGQYMQFETNSSEWARLNSNGNFLIGTTSDNGSKLQVSGTATFSSSVQANTMSIGIAPQTDKLFVYNASGTNTGLTIQQDGTGDIFRANGNSGANRFVVQQGGNVGIGTSSPNTRLHVAADATYSSNWDSAQLWVTGSDTAKRLQIGYDSTNGYGIIQAIHGGVSVKPLILQLQGGNVGIGTTNPTYGKLQLNSDSQDAFAICLASNANQQLVLGYNSASNYSRIQSVNQGVSYTSLYLNKDGGAVYAGSVRLDILSDERVKDNIQNIDGALNKVLSITGKKFHLKDEEEGKLRYGFIAQELEGILDEFVIQTDITFKKDDLEVENVKSIENWASSWSALLVEAIKEQQEIINNLSAKVTALENKI